MRAVNSFDVDGFRTPKANTVCGACGAEDFNMEDVSNGKDGKRRATGADRQESDERLRQARLA